MIFRYDRRAAFTIPGAPSLFITFYGDVIRYILTRFWHGLFVAFHDFVRPKTYDSKIFEAELAK
jgi:hypothetical protein